jgi:hypothetical protein
VTGELNATVGNGFVSLFYHNGTFARRFATGGALAAPFGLAFVNESLGGNTAGRLLVGNVGDGRILSYEWPGPVGGANAGTPATVGVPVNAAPLYPGLYGIRFVRSAPQHPDASLYFVSSNGTNSIGLLGRVQACTLP